MADFILNRKISVDTYPQYEFPKYTYPIYGNGKFYNGFSIGDTTNLTVVNKDGVLKFSRGAANENEETAVFLGTIPKNEKTSIYIDIASPLSQYMTYNGFKIGRRTLSTINEWTIAGITNTRPGLDTDNVQAGGVLGIYFQNGTALAAIPDLLAVRAIWLK